MKGSVGVIISREEGVIFRWVIGVRTDRNQFFIHQRTQHLYIYIKTHTHTHTQRERIYITIQIRREHPDEMIREWYGYTVTCKYKHDLIYKHMYTLAAGLFRVPKQLLIELYTLNVSALSGARVKANGVEVVVLISLHNTLASTYDTPYNHTIIHIYIYIYTQIQI